MQVTIYQYCLSIVTCDIFKVLLFILFIISLARHKLLVYLAGLSYKQLTFQLPARTLKGPLNLDLSLLDVVTLTKILPIMKNTALIMLCMVLCCFVSCEKDNDTLNTQIPDELEGTWVRDLPEDGERYIFTFEKVDNENGLIDHIWLLKFPDPEVFNIHFAAKGSFTIKDNELIVTLEQIGAEITMWINEDETLHDTTKWFYPGDPEFDNFEPENEQLFFELSGNMLTLTADSNGDGDFNDEGETTFFTRQE